MSPNSPIRWADASSSDESGDDCSPVVAKTSNSPRRLFSGEEEGSGAERNQRNRTRHNNNKNNVDNSVPSLNRPSYNNDHAKKNKFDRSSDIKNRVGGSNSGRGRGRGRGAPGRGRGRVSPFVASEKQHTQSASKPERNWRSNVDDSTKDNTGQKSSPKEPHFMSNPSSYYSTKGKIEQPVRRNDRKPQLVDADNSSSLSKMRIEEDKPDKPSTARHNKQDKSGRGGGRTPIKKGRGREGRGSGRGAGKERKPAASPSKFNFVMGKTGFEMAV